MSQPSGTAEPHGQQVGRDLLLARLERLPFGRVHLKVAGILGTGTFFDAFDSLAIAVVLSTVITHFSLDLGVAGWLISSAYIGQFIGALVMGVIAEKFGRRLGFVLALGVFGLLSLCAATAWNFESLLVFRFLQGIGLGAEVPIAGALFNEFIRGRSRGKVVMIYESIFSWGILLAPLIGLLFFTIFGPDVGWRAMFVVGGAPVIVAVIAWFALPESPRWLADNGRVAEADRLITAMEADAARRGVILEDPVPGSVPVPATQRTRFGELFSPAYLRRTILSWFLWFCGYFILYGFSTWLPTLFTKIGGLPTNLSLWLVAGTSAVYLIEVYVFALTVDRVGRKPWFVAGFLVAALGAGFGVTATALGLTAWPVLLIAGLLMGLGISPITAGVYLYTPELFPTRMRAWATASSSGLNRIASTIGPILLGALLATGLGLPAVFVMFGLVAVAGLIAMITLGIETKQRVLEDLSP